MSASYTTHSSPVASFDMRQTRILTQYHSYLGPWGALGSLPQKGIIHYGIAQNRQNPLAGTLNAAVFNTFRRTRGQILYWGVPLLIGYELMQWATER